MASESGLIFRIIKVYLKWEFREPNPTQSDIIKSDIFRLEMKFERFFRLVSYAAVFCGFLSLCVSGAFGIVGTFLFAGLMVAAWRLEGSRWQISERLGTALIVLA